MCVRAGQTNTNIDKKDTQTYMAGNWLRGSQVPVLCREKLNPTLNPKEDKFQSFAGKNLNLPQSRNPKDHKFKSFCLEVTGNDNEGLGFTVSAFGFRVWGLGFPDPK